MPLIAASDVERLKTYVEIETEIINIWKLEWIIFLYGNRNGNRNELIRNGNRNELIFYMEIEMEIGMIWQMKIEIEWEWFDTYGIENRNRNDF